MLLLACNFGVKSRADEDNAYPVFPCQKMLFKNPFFDYFRLSPKKDTSCSCFSIVRKNTPGDARQGKKRLSPNPWNKLPEDIMKRRFTLQRNKEDRNRERSTTKKLSVVACWPIFFGGRGHDSHIKRCPPHTTLDLLHFALLFQKGDVFFKKTKLCFTGHTGFGRKLTLSADPHLNVPRQTAFFLGGGVRGKVEL